MELGDQDDVYWGSRPMKGRKRKLDGVEEEVECDAGQTNPREVLTEPVRSSGVNVVGQCPTLG